MNINLVGIVQNTGIWKLYFSSQGDYVNITDKQWNSFVELSGDKAKRFIEAYKDKMIKYTTEGTKEYESTLDSILAGLYYDIV